MICVDSFNAISLPYTAQGITSGSDKNPWGLIDWFRNKTKTSNDKQQNFTSQCKLTFQAEEGAHLQVISKTIQEQRVDSLIQEIEEYRAFDAGWDGVCTEAPNARSLDSAQEFLRLIHREFALPNVAISGGEDVMLYWKDSSKYLALRFNSDDTLYYYYKCGTKKVSDRVKTTKSRLPKAVCDKIKVFS